MHSGVPLPAEVPAEAPKTTVKDHPRSDSKVTAVVGLLVVGAMMRGLEATAQSGNTSKS